MTDLDDVIDRLYGLPPSEFTAARNEAARDLAGDEAKQVKVLKRPSAAAHAVNVLVREHRELVEALVEVGDRLREAQESGDGAAIRALAGERRGHETEALDAIDGLSPSARDDVESTMRAVVLDPEAGDEVLAGRLVAGLDGSGFGSFASSARAPAKAPAPRPDTARRLARARRELEQRETEADQAEEARDAAAERVERTGAALEKAQREHDAAEGALVESTGASDEARAAADAASLAVASAERDHDAS